MKITSRRYLNDQAASRSIGHAAGQLAARVDGIAIVNNELWLTIVDKGRVWRVQLNAAETSLTLERLRVADLRRYGAALSA